MPTVVIFHSALGLRRDVRMLADRLSEAGNSVRPIDLFEGATFDDLSLGAARRDSIGIPELMRRAQHGVQGLADEIVYLGFSMGAALAELLAATAPGARGAVLIGGALAPSALGLERWPSAVAVELHHVAAVPLVDMAQVAALRDAVRAATARFDAFTYSGSGHLFTDPDLPGYDPASTEKLYKRVLRFVDYATDPLSPTHSSRA
jgi:dienelactone hydrolase